MSTELKDQINAKLDGIEDAVKERLNKVDEQLKVAGTADKATENEIANLKEMLNTQAETLARINQVQSAAVIHSADAPKSLGEALTSDEKYKAFSTNASARSLTVDIKNAATTSTDTTSPGERVPGAWNAIQKPTNLEDNLLSLSTSNNAVEYVQEGSTTNNIKPKAQGAAGEETEFGFTLISRPVRSIRGFTLITRELANDNASLASYIDNRLVTLLNELVEDQLINGNNSGQNLDGLLQGTTAHTKNRAAVGGANAKLQGQQVIQLVKADQLSKGFGTEIIVLNPIDYAKMMIDQGTSDLHGLPITDTVVQSPAIAENNLLLIDRNSVAVYNREGVLVRLSEEDSTNIRAGLVTISIERRLTLAKYAPNGLVKGLVKPTS